MTTEHLPECPAPLCDWGDPSAECMGYEDCHHLCCCDALRACEQRVLDAAREAVERVSSLLQPLGPALAAIDELRNPPSLPPTKGRAHKY